LEKRPRKGVFIQCSNSGIHESTLQTQSNVIWIQVKQNLKSRFLNSLLKKGAWESVLLCFIDPRVRKIRNEAFSCPGIFSRTLRFYYVASSPGSSLPHLLDGHGKLVGCSAIPARSSPGPVRYHWGSMVELEMPPDETPGLMTIHAHNTNVLQC